MSALRLGDVILDFRRAIYIPDLRALICAGLPKSPVLLKKLVADYGAESLVILGGMGSSPTPGGWAKTRKTIDFILKLRLRLICVSQRNEKVFIQKLSKQILKFPARLEFHRELVWDRYRFVEQAFGDGAVPPMNQGGVLTIAAHSTDVVLNGVPVFIKGNGKLVLPSLEMRVEGNETCIYRESTKLPIRGTLSKYNVFAVGVNSVIPVGTLKFAKQRLALLKRRPQCITPLKVHQKVTKKKTIVPGAVRPRGSSAQ